MNSLSGDLIVYLTSFLNRFDSYSLIRTCRMYSKLLKDQGYWRNRILFDFPEKKLGENMSYENQHKVCRIFALMEKIQKQLDSMKLIVDRIH